MTLTELQKLLTAADPAAVLVSPRVVERVIQEVCHIQGLRWRVPHREAYVVDRHVLFRFVEQDDLTIHSHQLLPAKVILLARPSGDELKPGQRKATLLEYWRRLFHCNIHLVLEDRWEQGLLTLAEVHDRADRIGRTEFEEVRAVLFRDNYLPRGSTDRDVYIEFAAVFLTLWYFDRALLSVYFPAVRDLARVAELVRQDFDADAMYRRTRLEGAPDPDEKADNSSYESHEYYWKLIRQADRAAELRNTVKAAIIRTLAARVAPAELTPTTRADAERHLRDLTDRLRPPLQLSDGEAGELFEDLKRLLDKADQGRHPVEASILYEMQDICVDHEREIYDVGIVEWAFSGGKRPIKRPLPSQRLVRIIRHLRAVVQKLTAARLTNDDRQHLTDLLNDASHRAEERLRERFRPVLKAVMEDVGLAPSNPLEETAFRKMIEEFLDRIASAGFVTFGDLRDTISRNQLKMPDLPGPQDFIRGDPLIRLDGRLASSLDGVYRPSEFHVRWLEQLSALNFGTRVGRFVTRFITVPFGGAFIAVEGVRLLFHLDAAHGWNPTWLQYLLTLGGVGLFFLLVLVSPDFRGVLGQVGGAAGRSLRWLTVDLPVWLVRVPWLRNLLTSWPVQLFYWFVFKPGALCALLWLVWPGLFGGEEPNPVRTVGLFLIAAILWNSRVGMALNDTVTEGAVDLYHLLRSGLLSGLYRLVVGLFQQVTHVFEFLLFKVDEWLQYRSGDTEFSLFLRSLGSVLWFPFSFLSRFVVIVLVEPMVNPMKLPIAFLIGKLTFPLIPYLTLALQELAPPYEGGPSGVNEAAATAATVIWFFGANAITFLIWELKENWSLYRANRPRWLRPAVIGGHGETMRGLLQPGFHSGTVPALFARMRAAQGQAQTEDGWRAVRSCQRAVDEVKNAVGRFVTREMLTLLYQSAAWRTRPLSVGRVRLASNRVEVELVHDRHPEHPVWLQFDCHRGWLTAQVRDPGWLPSLTAEQLWPLLGALSYLYKLGDVDFVHEQIRSALPPGCASYEITDRGLVVWGHPANPPHPAGPPREHGRPVYYNVDGANSHIVPVSEEGEKEPSWPVLETSKLVFARSELTWNQLVQAWQEDSHGRGRRESSPELRWFAGQSAAAAVAGRVARDEPRPVLALAPPPEAPSDAPRT